MYQSVFMSGMMLKKFSGVTVIVRNLHPEDGTNGEPSNRPLMSKIHILWTALRIEFLSIYL